MDFEYFEKVKEILEEEIFESEKVYFEETTRKSLANA